MTIVNDSIAAQVAALARTVAAPTGNLGYGTDLSCVSDLTDTMAEVDPFSTTAIAEATIRRLSTPRGMLPDDPDYGLDIRGYLNKGTPASQLASLSGPIRTEVRKDDRVDDAAVTASYAGLGSPKLLIAIMITPVDATLGTFTLTLAVTDGTVLLEAIT